MPPFTAKVDPVEYARVLRADAEVRALSADFWAAGRLLGAALVIESMTANACMTANARPSEKPRSPDAP